MAQKVTMSDTSNEVGLERPLLPYYIPCQNTCFRTPN